MATTETARQPEAAAHEDVHDPSHDEGEVHAHVAPWQLYVAILVALLFLTFLTVSAARVNIDGVFGNPTANTLNLTVALLIATTKAGLVGAFFMHLRQDKLFHTIAFLAAFVFFAIFLLLTRDDLALRHRLDPDYGSYVSGETGDRAPGGITFTPAPNESAEMAGTASGAPPVGSAAAPASSSSGAAPTMSSAAPAASSAAPAASSAAPAASSAAPAASSAAPPGKH